MSITTIIWDIGGVLERTEDPTPRLALAQSLGMPVRELEDLIFGNSTAFRVQLGLVSLNEHFAYVQSELGLNSREELDVVVNQFFAGDRLDTELVNRIRELKKTYTTAVLSNYSEVLRSKIEDIWQIGDAFDHLIISFELGVKKPDPKIYRVAVDTIGCRPQEAVFIDDDPQNIQAAQDFGLYGIRFLARDQALNALDILLAEHS